MIRITIENMGPHDRAHMAVPTLADIEGDSEAGKTHLVHALALAVCGVDGHGRKWDSRRRRDESAPARVKIAAPGIAIERKLGKRPGSVQLVGTGRLSSQSALDEALQMTGRRDLVLSILAPGYWQRLLDTPKARGLRDMLATVLPQVDTRAIVAATMEAHGGLQDSDPLVLGSASKRETVLHLQRETNSDRQRLEGQLAAHSATLDAIVGARPVAPDAEAVDTAKRRVQLEKQRLAHDAYIRADAQNRIATEDHALHLQAWRERRRYHGEREEAAAKGWRTRRAALGDKPTPPDYAPPSLDEHLQRVQAAQQQAADLVVTLADLDVAEKAAEDLVAISTADSDAIAHQEQATLETMLSAGKCPTCGHEVSEAALQAQRAVASKASAAHDDALATARQQHVEAVEAIEAKRSTVEAELRTARAMVVSAEKRRDVAQAAVDRHAAAVQAVERWQTARDALGDAPTPTPFTEPRPELRQQSIEPVRAPNLDGLPTLQAARETLQAAGAFARRLADWTTRRDRQTVIVQAARDDLRAASLECDRVAALVQAVREAPTVAARRQVATLHDAMASDRVHVHIAGPEESGDSVRVERDGRPWWMASNGAQAMLDLVLRDALRTLAIDLPGLGWLAGLPVIVDNAQDWSGEWPVDCWSGPVWWLRTVDTDGDALTVFDASEG